MIAVTTGRYPNDQGGLAATLDRYGSINGDSSLGEKDTIQLPEDSAVWLKQAREYRNGYIKCLALTGGEPFFIPDSLRLVSGLGEEPGFVISVVTSAFWASSPQSAANIIGCIESIKGSIKDWPKEMGQMKVYDVGELFLDKENEEKFRFPFK